MWQSIPRTGSLLLRASRPHSFQRFTRCLLSSLHAPLPVSSGFPAASSLLPPCCSPCVQRFPGASSTPSMPRPLRPAVYPLPPLLPPCLAPCIQRFPRCLLSFLHPSLPASSGFPLPPLLPPCCSPCVQRFTRCPSLPPTPCHHH